MVALVKCWVLCLKSSSEYDFDILKIDIDENVKLAEGYATVMSGTCFIIRKM